MDECIWEYRPGLNGTHFAYTPCQPGLNFLSRLGACKPYVGVANFYNGQTCPICGKRIQMDYKLIKEE